MNPTTVYQVQAEIERHLPSLGKWQASGLALVVLGILAQEHCHLSQLAEHLPSWGAFNTVKQRLKRWVQNPRLKVTTVCEEWVSWVWSSWRSRRPVLLVDETKLGERVGVMMVSLAYAGRAIPLAWRCYHANSAPDYPAQGQVLLVYGLLAHVLSGLPATVRPVVEMDRGLAHSAAMLRALKSLQVDFLVRVKQTARFTSRRGHSQLLSQLVQYGESSSLQGCLFGRDHAVSGRICLIWERGQCEAWCLFTNVRSFSGLSGSRYALRCWQEESFKDLKSGGWQWQQSHIRCPERMARLLLAMAIAYGWMLSLGSQLGDQPYAVYRQVATADDWQRYSLFRLGLRWFKRFIHSLAPPPVPVAFCFKPPPLHYVRP
jgi:hypothetical protein